MDSISLLESMVAEQPENGKAWYLLGIEYLKAERMADALRAFSRALEHSTDGLRQQVLEQLAGLRSGGSAGAGGAAETRGSGEVPASSAGGERTARFRVIKGGADAAAQAEAEEKADDRVITFADVGGLEDLKKSIRLKIIDPFFNVGLFAKFRKRAGGGILLYGPPGCGKTFIARATAGECRAQFINVRITDILNPYIGVSERNLKSIFEQARRIRPAVLFFDELDALAYQRGRGSHHLRPLTDLFLNELDGMQGETDQVLVLGATNLPWDVDPAFKRPGRFDRMVFVPPPDEEARRTIFGLKLKDRPVEGIDVNALARSTELFSGADIESAVEAATERVLDEIMASGQERPLVQEDLLKAVRSMTASTLEWLRTVRNYVEYANQTGQYDDVERYLGKVKRLL